MTMMDQSKRVTIKCKCPNPLFQKWILTLYEEAVKKNNSSQYTIKEALTSLKKYPLCLQSGLECAILKGFGKKLCSYLDSKLATYQQNQISNSVYSLSKSPSTVQCSTNSLNTSRKSYNPAYRSGPYAILIALLEHIESKPCKPVLNKTELIERASPLCDESFLQPKSDTRYTAWSSMTRLIKKNLIKKNIRKQAEYTLTNDGYNLALQLRNQYKDKIIHSDDFCHNFEKQVNSEITIKDDVNLLINEQRHSLETASINDNQIEIHIISNENNIEEFIPNPKQYSEDLTLYPSSFEVILLIDKQETSGKYKNNDPTVLQFKKYAGLKHEYRHLKVGDFTWIAKCNNTQKELVLPYIVERKRMDDLASSIKDGRFHEQKFRLKNCGITNVMYLIENYGDNKHVGLPVLSLMQAVVNTRVQNRFLVHFTDSLAGTVKFLAMMTKRLTIEFQNKTLRGYSNFCEEIAASPTNLILFSQFNTASAKTKALTVTEMFIKLLLSLKGMSVDKALAITSVYKTPRLLVEAYRLNPGKDGEKLLADLKNTGMSKSVGPSVSKAVYKMFSSQSLL